ncbi:envelope integrity protein Cei [Mycobacterium sp. M1]|uniref:Envelope integrity protein Cei n=1 Tax=Mycolicibacter acidiphilus TaxID=2835306 RepID=A0ABS5RF07_9MYCO|nr:envelope integrity protein Cei [Mycolicibacter acidiphilus]MBS9532026.1 envelope integrity protein Cei [Mycolicibacter acidiphilus]
MVAQITQGSEFDKHGRPFRRRNFRPAGYALACLALLTGAVWVVALTRPPDVHEIAACNPPPAPTGPDQPRLGAQVPRTALASTTPAKLAEVKATVLNATGRAGQAADVADAMRDDGFAQPAAANDPVYDGARLDCQGQIRFGEAGRAAAAAVWLVAPCTELFRDDRTDDSVDLAIGTDFTSLAHSNDIQAALAGLRPDATGLPDPALLTKIHSGTC